jgi:hypothetical protein
MAKTRTATQIPQVNQEQGESTMSELDAKTQQIEQLFAGIGASDLEEWRYAYRKIIYAGAMKILRDHPEIIIGSPPDPSSEQQQQQQQQQRPASGGAALGNPGRNPVIDGQPPPYRPSAVCHLVCIVLGD